jgi:flagellar motor switch/type III secretory pathway protein FliN
MATAHTLAPPAAGPAEAEHNEASASDATEQALVPAPAAEQQEAGIELTGPVALLPVELDVAVPVRNFRVRNLLALEPSHLIETGWGHGGDVPLSAGHIQLAWSEFEVIETALAVRLTRLV